jgi:hypothetical protein
MVEEIDQARQWHSHIAQQCGAEYLFVHDLTRKHHGERPANWGKVSILNQLLHDAVDGEHVLYMDCDVVVVNPLHFKAWMRTPWPSIAMVPVSPAIAHREGRYNAGVIPMVVSPTLRRFWRDVAIRAARRLDHRDQVQICAALEQFSDELQFEELPYELNDYPYAKGSSKHPIIRAWHGVDPMRKWPAMAAALINAGAMA